MENLSASKPACSKISKRFFLLGLLPSALGAGIGAVLFLLFSQRKWQNVTPLFFSGIPHIDAGFFICFSTLLANTLLALIVLFFFGMTAFGVFAVPLFFLLKGVTVGIGAVSLLVQGSSTDILQCVLLYMPTVASSFLICFFFARHALAFSERMRCHMLSAEGISKEEQLDFWCYFRTLLCFLALAVILSLFQAFPAALYPIFFL